MDFTVTSACPGPVPRAPIAARLRDERGTTLIETAVAMAILIVMMLGLLSLSAVATVVMENEGHLTARTAEYAQDKMEQLLALKYGDEQSDTTVFPVGSSGGSGLAQGGNSDPSKPEPHYVDYLDANGNLLDASGAAAPAGWYYKRVWSIAEPSANLKRITVTATVVAGLGHRAPPRSTLSTFKVFPF